MHVDRSRLFLLSMVGVPAACGPGVAPGGSGYVTPIPIDDDEGLDPATDTRTDGCEAFLAQLHACYGSRPDYGGEYGGEFGGSYGEGGGYYTSDGGLRFPTDIKGECDAFYADYIAYYGPRCADAFDDAYACMAGLPCQSLDFDSGDFGTPCLDDFVEVEQACQVSGNVETGQEPDPDSGFEGCDAPLVSNDTNICVAQYTNCTDGNSYIVTCTPPPEGGLHVCVCQTNGVDTDSFQLENPCADGTYESLAPTTCGYPV